MTEADFQALAKQGYTRVPVVLEARADLYTPLAVYLKLASGPFTYLLESVVGGERFGRYSFIGLACAERIEARGGVVRRLLREARGKDDCVEIVGTDAAPADPFEYLRGYLARQHVAPVPAALRFGGGLVGYFGYETVRHVEPTALPKARASPMRSARPTCCCWCRTSSRSWTTCSASSTWWSTPIRASPAPGARRTSA